MLENLIFSLNIMLPLFLLILLGVYLKRKDILTEEVRTKVTKLVFNYSLFSKIFLDMSSLNMSEFDMKFAVYMIASTFITFYGGWLFFKLVLKDPQEICACTHGCFRGNYAYVGLPVISNILNTTTTCVPAMIVLSTVIPLYNVFGVIILSHYDPRGKKISVAGQIKSILKNPIIIALLLGLPFSVFHISIPSFANKTLSYMGQLAAPLALLMIGASLKTDTFKDRPVGIILTTALKTVIFPLLFTGLAVVLGFGTEAVVTVFVTVGVPTATNSFIMAKDMGGDADLAAGIVMATSIVSMVTMTIGIFMLKSAGII